MSLDTDVEYMSLDKDVEHNFIEPRRNNIRNLLLSKGYIYIGENEWDDMYKHNSI